MNACDVNSANRAEAILDIVEHAVVYGLRVGIERALHIRKRQWPSNSRTLTLPRAWRAPACRRFAARVESMLLLRIAILVILMLLRR